MGLRSRENYVGAWAFLIGVVLAVAIGLLPFFIDIPLSSKSNSALYGLLILLGMVLGFMANVSGKEGQTFLIAGAVLVIVSGQGMSAGTASLIGFPIAQTVTNIFGALTTLFVPATIIVALKTVFSVSNI